MGLTEWLMREAARDPRPLVVSVPYGTRTRLHVEAELAGRGWVTARSPAEAGMLVVCGDPGEEPAQAVRRVWADLPTPRALVELPSVSDAASVAQALDMGKVRLADARAQRRDAAERLSQPWRPDADEQAHGPEGGHSAHGGHDHHMGSPGGLKMAERADDRDGLKLDRLHLPLGPVLTDWPGGLVVETAVQGDVIQHATVKVVDGISRDGEGSFWDAPWLEAMRGRPITRGQAERRRAASHLDSLGRLLAVAGWPAEAARARRLRDRALAGASLPQLAPTFNRFAGRVGGSWILRWMLRDVGDVGRRVRVWLTETRTALDALADDSPLADDRGPRGPVSERPSARLLTELPDLLAGAELAAARLIVAGLDPDVEQVLHA
ncbi:hypothetical protein EDD27_5271 [Nonomuraea polychroma]|uniref:Uncharacterized protein n=1 Tax=Nonomuraea polychroma TaxID=46176 RepID=A0A438MAG7_9ACTN|nr:hypothetical protein [Nonomuraea polychroma]RVX42635.1 hypothetical protein EDD27_5271 [Nonomuraea polychroma]